MGADTVNITKIIALRTGGPLDIPEDRAFECLGSIDAEDSTGAGEVSGPQSLLNLPFQNLGTHLWHHPPPPKVETERHRVTWNEKDLTCLCSPWAHFPVTVTWKVCGACSLTHRRAPVFSLNQTVNSPFHHSGWLPGVTSPLRPLFQPQLQMRTRKLQRCHHEVLDLLSCALCTMLVLTPKIKTTSWFFFKRVPREIWEHLTFLIHSSFSSPFFSSHSFYLVTKM